jgi:hypothetical protein
MFVSKRRTYLAYNYINNHIDTLPRKSGDAILTFYPRMDWNQQGILQKKFFSFSHSLSFIGGLSKGLSIVLLAIVFPFREILYTKKFINEMFNVCINEQQMEMAYKCFIKSNDNDDDDE